MRKTILGLALITLMASACSSSSSETSGSPAGGGSPSGNACAPQNLALKTPNTLTIGTDDTVYGPWFAGPGTYGSWKTNPATGTGNPASGRGFESATAYAMAEQLGFTKSQVTWVPLNFNQSYKPGPKDFDFYIGQVSYLPQRAQAVDFSEGYYNLQQALVAHKGTPLANAKTFAEIQPYQLGAQVSTTSYNYIVDNIHPDQQPKVYDQSTDLLQAFNNGQIDGYLVDVPTAYVNVLIGEAKDAVVVGQFPTIGDQEYVGVIFEKGNPLVSCVNQAITALKDDGALAGLQKKWLRGVSYPVIQQ